MRIRNRLVVVLWSFSAAVVAAQHGPVLGDVVVHRDAEPARVEFTLRWPNAWCNARNHDAAWVVLRSPDARRGPLRLADAGHALTGEVEGRIELSPDRLGAFVAVAAPHQGAVVWQVTLALDEVASESVTPWAVGMVFVPDGAFDLGDDDPLTLRFGAFHTLDADGAPAPLRIESEATLAVANEPGALWFEPHRAGYHGTPEGPVPAAWPKGTRAFYVMKRELTQGEYAAFLNALPAQWQARRAPLELKGEETASCSISREAGRFVAAAPARPCNFVSWDDTCALFDWLALRPITEFEFEKAARGPSRPAPGDYPWGTASLDGVMRKVLPTRDLAAASVEDEARLSDAERVPLGASYYWVMDLAGSVWERVVSAGHPTGRAFTGSHGDGVLSEAGSATNDDWPSTDPDGKDAPGVGFRGGADYFKPARADDPTNPFSRVATRTYAGWGGAERYKTYSARAGRTAGGR